MAHDGTQYLNEAARRVQQMQHAASGGMSPEALKAVLENGSGLMGQVAEHGGKMLDADSLMKVAGQHATGDMKKILHHAGNISENGIDLQGLANIAASGDIPMNEDTRKFFEAFAHNGNKPVDMSEAAKLPGMIVNKDTGTVSLLGVVDLPPQAVQGLVAGYTMFLHVINGHVWDKSYKGGRAVGAMLEKMPALAKLGATPESVAALAAYAAVFGTTHWMDVNTFMSERRTYQHDAVKLAGQMGPLLDDYKGGHSVAKLFAIKPEDNEMIFNERRRLNVKHNAQVAKNTIQILERLPMFVASVKSGLGRSEAVDAKAHADAAKATLAGASSDLEQRMSTEWKRIDALELPDQAKHRMFDAKFGLADSEAKLHTAAEHPTDMAAQITAYASTLGTFIIRGLSDGFYKKSTKNVQPISAFEMVVALKKQLDDDPKQARFSLPDGMRIEGARGSGATELPLAEYVQQIFQQHEKDSAGNEAHIPPRLTERLKEVSGQIAEALGNGQMDGLALVKLVGERKIVKSGGKSIAEREVVTHELDKQKAHMRHVEWVDAREYFADSSFSKEQLTEAWSAMAEEEKDLFVGMVPTQVLEAAGVKGEDIKERRQRREERFHEDLTHVVKGLVAMGDDTLKQLNATKPEIDLFHKAAQATSRHGAEAINQFLPSAGNSANLADPLTEILVHHAQHGGKISDIVSRGIE